MLAIISRLWWHHTPIIGMSPAQCKAHTVSLPAMQYTGQSTWPTRQQQDLASHSMREHEHDHMCSTHHLQSWA